MMSEYCATSENVLIFQLGLAVQNTKIYGHRIFFQNTVDAVVLV